jgi:hypothetical protein
MTRTPFFLALTGALLSLAGLLACGGGGGGGGTAAAAGPSLALVYTDPPATGYRFVRDAQLSTASHLVLDLVGPASDQGRGVAFALQITPGVVGWAKVAAADPQYLQNALFDPGPGVPLLKSALQGGTTLLADDFQKGAGNGKLLTGTICRVALDTQAALTTAGGIALAVTDFQLLPATGASLTDLTANCAVGTLTVQ